MGTKKDLIDQILDIEWEMFSRIKSATTESGQSAHDNFPHIRGSIYEIWTKRMLESYLGDLQIAQVRGRNLFTEKYARMDNLIPPLNTNPLIDLIVEIEAGWQTEVLKQYPTIRSSMCRSTANNQDGRNFSTCLKSELETYSDQTIKLYYEHVKKARHKNVNLTLLTLERLLGKAGLMI